MIENTTTKITYAGDGETSSFSIPFAFFEAGSVAAVRTAADGTETALANDTDFSVSVSAQGAALLALTAPLPTGTSLTIFRNQAPTQAVSLVGNARFPSSVVETGFDRIVMTQQMHDEKITRAVTAPVHETPTQAEVQLPARAQRLGGVLGWDLTGAMTCYENPVQAIALTTAAKNSAETAKADAQTAKTAAQTAQNAAGASATQAAASATAAAGSANTASAKADAAAASATSASASADSASNSASAAENSLNFYNALAYQGTCTALPGNPTRGQFWVVAQAFDSYAAGDAILYNGTAWQSLDLDTLTAQAQADARAQTNAAIAARGMTRCPNIQCACADFGTFPLSICFSYRRNAAWVNGTYVAYKVTSGPGAAAPHFVVYVGGNANHFIFGFTKNTPTGGGLHVAYPIAKFPTDGRLHTVVFTLASGTYTDGKCYIDGNFVPYTGPGDVSFGTITDFANTSEMTLGLMNISLSRMKIFNFVLPATAAADCALATPYGYSAEAYANGEDEPTALRDTSATARALLSLDDRTCGGVLFDRSGAENHARFTGDAAPEKPAESCAFTQALSWAGTSEAKAFLNANAITLPANARVCARLKASAGATFNLTDGAATPTTLATSGALTADAWGEVVFYTSAASKLALKPTAAYTGTLDVQVRIEKLK